MYFFRNNDDYPEKVSPTAILLAINQQEVRPLPLSVSLSSGFAKVVNSM